MNNLDDLKSYVVNLAVDLIVYMSYMKQLPLKAAPRENASALSLLKRCHDRVAKRTVSATSSAVLLELVQAMSSCNIVTCFQAVCVQPMRLSQLLSFMLLLACPTHEELTALVLKQDAKPLGAITSFPDEKLFRNPEAELSLRRTLVSKVRFTPELGAVLKQKYPTASLLDLVRMAVQKYDCAPSFETSVTFRDACFRIMGPYVELVPTSADSSRAVAGAGGRTYTINDRQHPYLSAMLKRQVSYCFAYECLYPSSVPEMSKYKVY